MEVVTWLTLNFSDKYFLRLHQMQAVKTPTKRNQNSVYNMIEDTQSQVSSESEWIRQRRDLAAVGHGAEYGWFNGFVEDMLNKVSPRLILVSSATAIINDCTSMLPFQLQDRIIGLTCAICSRSLAPKNSLSSFEPRFSAPVPKEISSTHLKYMSNFSQKIFRSRAQHEQSGHDSAIRLISRRRLDIFLRTILTIIAAVLLLAPVIILVQLQPNEPSQVTRSNWLQIMTIFLFTLVFSGSCSIFTRATRQEVFTATAAYCAVLVVFLANTSNVVIITNRSSI